MLISNRIKSKDSDASGLLMTFQPDWLSTQDADEVKAKLREVFDRETARAPVDHVILSFRNVEFMDSAAVGVLVGFWKYVALAGGPTLRLCELHPRLERHLHLCKLHHIFAIHDSVEAASEAGGVEVMPRTADAEA